MEIRFGIVLVVVLVLVVDIALVSEDEEDDENEDEQTVRDLLLEEQARSGCASKRTVPSRGILCKFRLMSEPVCEKVDACRRNV